MFQQNLANMLPTILYWHENITSNYATILPIQKNTHKTYIYIKYSYIAGCIFKQFANKQYSVEVRTHNILLINKFAVQKTNINYFFRIISHRWYIKIRQVFIFWTIIFSIKYNFVVFVWIFLNKRERETFPLFINRILIILCAYSFPPARPRLWNRKLIC